MVKIKMEPINVSNTTLSRKGTKRHRKFDAKQAKRHNFEKAFCAICGELFTKKSYQHKYCSDECVSKNRRKKRQERMKDPAYRKRMAEVHKKWQQDPKNKKRRNKQQRAYNARTAHLPEYKEKERKRNKNPKRRAQIRKRYKERWANDPEFREREKARQRTEHSRTLRNKRNRERRANEPGYKERILKLARKNYALRKKKQEE